MSFKHYKLTTLIVKYNIISVLFFLISNITLAQIKGVIKDQDQNHLFGATVYNTINNKSTITNEEGIFSIDAINGQNKLVISYVGYTPRVVNVDGNNKDLGTIVLENNGDVGDGKIFVSLAPFTSINSSNLLINLFLCKSENIIHKE